MAAVDQDIMPSTWQLDTEFVVMYANTDNVSNFDICQKYLRHKFEYFQINIYLVWTENTDVESSIVQSSTL